VLVVSLVLRKSALGMMIESVGVNPNASRMAGLRPKMIVFTVYVISAVLASFGGVFLTGYTMTVNPSQTGWSFEMYAILAVVIGGTSLLGGKFSMAGAYIGAIIISLITTTIVWLGISNQATPAFTGLVVIVICVLQSDLVRRAFQRRRRKPAVATGGVAA
jgi:simple sugar transport system permease protein